MSLYPIFYTAFNGYNFSGLITVIMAVLVVWAHRSNIKRLFDGKESKLSFGKKKKDANGEPAEEAPAEAPAPLTEDIAPATDKSRSPVFVTEKPDVFEFEDDGKHEFVTCTGCGHTIPRSRKVCLYCNTKNLQYIPDPENETANKGKKKKTKK